MGDWVGIRTPCPAFKDKSRFLELPCLPGDKVFLISFINKREIKEYKVFSMPMMMAKNNNWFQINLENQRGAILGDFHFSDIGKTIFLTREEAEQALKEREENA
jgi:hypothetical protein